MDVTAAMKEYAETKISKLTKYYDNLHSVEVIFDIEAEQPLVEIIVTASRKATFVATHRNDDLYACIDVCSDKISQQLRRHKDKVRNRHSAPLSETSMSQSKTLESEGE